MKPTGPEMNIGNCGRRPPLKPWIVLLKWTELADGSFISHDYRWRIGPHQDRFAVWQLNPVDTDWAIRNDSVTERICWTTTTVKALMIHAQDCSNAFRRQIWELINGPYQPPARRAR
jgi:hypothetical protein